MHMAMISDLRGPLFPNWGVVNSSSLHWGVFVGVDSTDTTPASLSASVKLSMDSDDGLVGTSSWYSMPFPGSAKVASLSLSPPWFDDLASTSGSTSDSPDSDSSLPWSPRFWPSSDPSSSDDPALDSAFAWRATWWNCECMAKLRKIVEGPRHLKNLGYGNWWLFWTCWLKTWHHGLRPCWRWHEQCFQLSDSRVASSFLT